MAGTRTFSSTFQAPRRAEVATARDQATRLRRQLIAWQEELDWQIYEAFGLVEGAAASGPAAVSLPEGEAMDRVAEFGLELGERAFEIVLARRIAAGEVQTTWFERHGSKPNRKRVAVCSIRSPGPMPKSAASGNTSRDRL